MLEREDPRGIRRGHVWTYIGDYDEVAFCEYTPDWEKEGACAVLSKFRGKVIQGDGYAGIDPVFQGDRPPIRAGCMDHCRRQFVKAVESGDARVPLFEYLRDVFANFAVGWPQSRIEELTPRTWKMGQRPL